MKPRVPAGPLNGGTVIRRGEHWGGQDGAGRMCHSPEEKALDGTTGDPSPAASKWLFVFLKPACFRALVSSSVLGVPAAPAVSPAPWKNQG